MPSFVTYLEAAIDGTRLPAERVQTVHQGRPLWVRYDLDAIRRCVSGPSLAPSLKGDGADADLAKRAATMWRYRELLPLPDGVDAITLGERITPLLPAPRLGAALGLSDLWIKDESLLPTGSFKSRGLAMAVTMAQHFGVHRLAIPTAGNAGGAMAVYAARAGMEAYVFMPKDTPVINRMECVLAGAKTYLVNGLITECGAIVRNGALNKYLEVLPLDLPVIHDPAHVDYASFGG